jgi:predicted nucleic acid-binding protein
VIVVDTTVLADFLIGDQKLKEAACMLAREDPDWITTGLWRYELGNVFWKKIQFETDERKRLMVSLNDAEHLLVETIDRVDRPAILDVACGAGLTYYDASYVWLARSRKLNLRTRDKRILERCADVALPMPIVCERS